MPLSNLISNVNPEHVIIVFLASALVGSLSAIIVAWISGRQSYKNEVLRLAITTAHQDFEQSQKIAIQKGENTYPMSSYIAFHYIYLTLLDKGKSPRSALKKALKMTFELMSEYQGAMFSDYNTKWKVDYAQTRS